MNKDLIFNDSKLGKKEDEASLLATPRGFVSIKNDLGELIYEGSNKIVLAGSTFTASKHFNLPPKVKTPSYNEILGLENSVDEPAPTGTHDGEQVFLFAVGRDGCGKTAKEVKPVQYNSWISPDFLVPFKYQPFSNDLSSEERKKYFGRKVIEGDKRIAYYFKKFESAPIFEQKYLDGTDIDENVYTSLRQDEIESYVKLHLTVTYDDCRDFFNQTVGREESELSSISILTAWEKVINGQVYYQDIRPLTKYHFPKENLIDSHKGLDITYLLYY